MTDFQLQVVYNVISFALAFMTDTTEFLIFRSLAVQAKYQSAARLPSDGSTNYVWLVHILFS